MSAPAFRHSDFTDDQLADVLFICNDGRCVVFPVDLRRCLDALATGQPLPQPGYQTLTPVEVGALLQGFLMPRRESP